MAQAAPPSQRQVFKIAYIYKDDLPTAKAYKLFLDQRGMEASLVTVGEAEGFDFKETRTIIIADDTITPTLVAGPTWAGSSKALSNIVNSGKYIVGLGYGGTLYFQRIQLEIGNGSPLSGLSTEALNPGHPIWQSPNAIALPPNLTPRLYNRSGPLLAPQNNTVNALISRIGVQPNDTDPDGKHYPLIAQQTRVGQCHLLWGWRLGLRHMTVEGQNLFENAVLANPCAQRVAYIYQENFTLATAFRDMLTGFGLSTDLISVSAAATADFSPYLAIIIGSESGNLANWGSAAAVNNINNSGKP
ncbi:MAG: hypothetical protein HC853_04080, partial [Anaerolineae bacterium]|nr:hypothetical protein [Anaerolineae bacterium]